MNLNQTMKTFIQVIERQSFIAAAKASYRSASQISKEVQWLEEELEVKLLHRSTRKLHITEAGQKVYDYAKHSIESYNQLTHSLKVDSNQLVGNIKMSTPASLDETHFRAYMSKFVLQHPKVLIQITGENRIVDLIAENIDVAIRAGKPNLSSLSYIKLFDIQRGVFASDKYLKQSPTIHSLADLQQHNCILHTDQSNPHSWLFKDDKKLRVDGNIISNSTQGNIRMACDGVGIIYTSDHLVPTSKLKPILKEFWPEPIPMYLCYPKQEFVPKHTLAFIEHLKSFNWQ